VYIDGFNLYYGALKNTPYKWLDVNKLCHLLLPKNDIIEIKYFTAKVKARLSDPTQHVRQQTYLRALGTLPNVSVVYGHFLSHPVNMLLANPPAAGSKYVSVIKTEEKGSDVNLATELLVDGFKNKYDVAVLITNDSDLLSPIKVVKSELNKLVGILNPQKNPSNVLKQEANFFKPIRQGVLVSSQFPQTLTDEKGTFHKPNSW
jgi:uncharacterized LabA/DUF88 family protein